jgi:hypothetical protein
VVIEGLFQEYQTTESTSLSTINITDVDPGTARAITLRQTDASLGEVIDNKVLTAPGHPIKRHIGNWICCVRASTLFQMLFFYRVQVARGSQLSRWRLLGDVSQALYNCFYLGFLRLDQLTGQSSPRCQPRTQAFQALRRERGDDILSFRIREAEWIADLDILDRTNSTTG